MKQIDEAQLEKLFSSQVRLKVVASLITSSPQVFSDIIETLGLTRGNLSSHMKQLEQSNIVKVEKKFVANKPQTSYSVTELGRESFTKYVKMLEQIISSVKED
jgi:DNA-binding HxlR family transcriptional regulator